MTELIENRSIITSVMYATTVIVSIVKALRTNKVHTKEYDLKDETLGYYISEFLVLKKMGFKDYLKKQVECKKILRNLYKNGLIEWSKRREIEFLIIFYAIASVPILLIISSASIPNSQFYIFFFGMLAMIAYFRFHLSIMQYAILKYTGLELTWKGQELLDLYEENKHHSKHIN